MNRMDMDLRNYLQTNHGQISWKTKIQICFDVVKAVCRIHEEKSIHRDLHSGNVLHLKEKNDWYISDLGFCGPVEKPLSSVYGSLPYIAPEVIFKSEYSFASDVYGIGMLIWEVVFEQPPFANHKHDYNLALNIVNGMRPKIIPETPSKLKKIMEWCWKSDPNERPKIRELWGKVEELYTLLHKNSECWNNTKLDTVDFNMNYANSSSKILSRIESKSKLHTFQDVLKPMNPATKGKYNI
jgi:serine/threonine protein kinase